MLRHADARDVVVVPLLHGAVSVVNCDPLEGGNAYSDLLFRSLFQIFVVKHFPGSLLTDLGQSAFADLDGAVKGAAAKGLEQSDQPAVLGILVVLQVHHVLGELLEPKGSQKKKIKDPFNSGWIQSASQRKKSRAQGNEREREREIDGRKRFG